jgi:DNA polymerase-3 subunit gamma/tau
MLGLADRNATLDLFEAVMKGDSARALSLLDELYKNGADPLMVVQDLSELTHYLTKLKVAPDIANDAALPEAERGRGSALALSLTIPVLARTWQMLAKGASEVQHAASPQQALEMLVIRLLYVSDQPTPGDVLKQLKDGSTVAVGGGSPAGAPRGATIMSRGQAAVAYAEPRAGVVASVNSYQDAVALFGQQRQALLRAHLENDVHLVSFAPGHISIRPRETAPANLAGRVSTLLSEWTGQRWMVSLSREQGEPTLAEIRAGAEKAVFDEVSAHPAVAEILQVFPGARVAEIRKKD